MHLKSQPFVQAAHHDMERSGRHSQELLQRCCSLSDMMGRLANSFATRGPSSAFTTAGQLQTVTLSRLLSPAMGGLHCLQTAAQGHAGASFAFQWSGPSIVCCCTFSSGGGVAAPDERMCYTQMGDIAAAYCTLLVARAWAAALQQVLALANFSRTS
jgi:hypothetical protein